MGKKILFRVLTIVGFMATVASLIIAATTEDPVREVTEYEKYVSRTKKLSVDMPKGWIASEYQSQGDSSNITFTGDKGEKIYVGFSEFGALFSGSADIDPSIPPELKDKMSKDSLKGFHNRILDGMKIDFGRFESEEMKECIYSRSYSLKSPYSYYTVSSLINRRVKGALITVDLEGMHYKIAMNCCEKDFENMDKVIDKVADSLQSVYADPLERTEPKGNPSPREILE